MKKALTFLSIFLSCASLYAYEMRTWTAMNGKTTEAAYVKYEADSQKVVMQKRDGSIIKVPRDSLCDEDWVYVSQFDQSVLRFTIKCGEIPAYLVSLPELRGVLDGSDPCFSGIIDGEVYAHLRSQLIGKESIVSFFVSSDNWMIIFCNNTEIASFPYSFRFWSLFDAKTRDGAHSALFASESDIIGSRRFEHQTSDNQYAQYAMWYEWQYDHKGKYEKYYTTLFVNSGWRNPETRMLSTRNETTSLFVVRGLDQNKLSDIALYCANLQSRFSAIPRYKRIKTLIKSINQGVPTDTPKRSIEERSVLEQC